MTVYTYFKGGGSFVDTKPQFSADSETVFVLWRNKIFGYSCKTGKVVSEFKTTCNKLVGFCVHSYDNSECISACSDTGEISLWKTVTYFKVKQEKLPSKGSSSEIRSFNVLPWEDKYVCLLAIKRQKSLKFITYDIDDQTFFKIKRSSLAEGECFYDLSFNGNYMALAQGCGLEYIRIVSGAVISNLHIMKSRHFTCVACHPEADGILITGDSSGRVIVWREVDKKTNAIQSVFHWHTLPVQCVSFSVGGQSFYSGGGEAVLLQWNLDRENPCFLPRLPSTIQHISVSPSNMYVAVSVADNSLRILDQQLTNISQIQQLIISDCQRPGMKLDPKTNALIMNGHAGHVQFYSPTSCMVLRNLDIVGQNKVSNERDCCIEGSEVVKFAVSSSGNWLATVEASAESRRFCNVQMKFWKFVESEQRFKLNTCVYQPHDGMLNNVGFKPCKSTNQLKCISVGEDKTFKLWQPCDSNDLHNKDDMMWVCVASGYHRNLPCAGLSYSMDGSLAAIGFGPLLTGWLPDSCTLSFSLTNSAFTLAPITSVEFGRNELRHMVVGLSTDRLTVWNILSLSMVWTVPLRASTLIADQLTPFMAIISNDNFVFIFRPDSGELLYESNAKAMFSMELPILSAAFVPTRNCNHTQLPWYRRVSLYVINAKFELYCLSQNDSIADISGVTPDIVEASTFSKLIPKSFKKSDVKELTLNKLKYPKNSAHFNKLFERSLHTMLPAHFVCREMLEAMVIQDNSDHAREAC